MIDRPPESPHRVWATTTIICVGIIAFFWYLSQIGFHLEFK